MKGDDKKAGEQEGEGGWQYKPGDDEAEAAGAAVPGPASEPVSTRAVEWTASEFVAHEKGPVWYVVLVVLSILVTAGIYFATHDILSTVVVIIMAGILAVASSHKPRVIKYRLDASGLSAGKKFYPYRDYKSFIMPDDGPFVSVMLIPLKRISLPVGAFLAPDSQQKALETLSEHVPLERRDPGLFDTIMRELRF